MANVQPISVAYQEVTNNKLENSPFFRFKDKNISEEFRTEKKDNPKVFLIPTSSNGKAASRLEKKYDKKYKFKKDPIFINAFKNIKLYDVVIFHHLGTNSYLIFFVIIDYLDIDHTLIDDDIYMVMGNLIFQYEKFPELPRKFNIHKIGENEFFRADFDMFKTVLDDVFDETYTFIVHDDRHEWFSSDHARTYIT